VRRAASIIADIARDRAENSEAGGTQPRAAVPHV